MLSNLANLEGRKSWRSAHWNNFFRRKLIVVQCSWFRLSSVPAVYSQGPLNKTQITCCVTDGSVCLVVEGNSNDNWIFWESWKGSPASLSSGGALWRLIHDWCRPTFPRFGCRFAFCSRITKRKASALRMWEQFNQRRVQYC